MKHVNAVIAAIDAALEDNAEEMLRIARGPKALLAEAEEELAAERHPFEVVAELLVEV